VDVIAPTPDAAPAVPRGTGWVIAQVVVGAAVVAVAAAGPPPRHLRRTRRAAAIVLGAAGSVLVLGARRDLGDAFSVFPRPPKDSDLVTGGMYGRVRHPMYTGVLAQAVATALAGSSWALLPAGALAVTLDRKAAVEERALANAHPGGASPGAPRWRFVPGLR
jgi:protein-S-isoprenylcysteine O-methyltransferase Ste14